MFSNKSYKYLKSLVSSRQKNLEKPAQFEDEFIMYAQTLVEGLNFESNHAYFLQYALSSKEDHDSMLGLIQQNGKSSSRPFIQIRTTAKGKFQLEWHIPVDYLSQTFEGEENSVAKTDAISQSPVFRRYFSFHHDAKEDHIVIRFEMPLRQLRSRNLTEYSIFILDLAQPFMEELKSLPEERQSIAA